VGLRFNVISVTRHTVYYEQKTPTVNFLSLLVPSSTYPLLVLLLLHPIARSDTHHSVGFLWTSDRPVAEALPDNIHHSKETYMRPTGFEPAVPANERPQTHALDCAATGTGRF
jgi:hypothetical protein